MDLADSTQLEKAKLEDVIVEILYREYNDLVFHGGTAIWRCYAGNRFSRDLDFYMRPETTKERMKQYRDVSKFLINYGFSMKEKEYNNDTETMHFTVGASNAKMKIGINLRYKNGIPIDYAEIDGGKIVVLSLSPTELLKEKITAYNDKLDNMGKFKHPEAHDLYDMWYLVTLIKKADRSTVKSLEALINKIGNKPPLDMRSLGHLIISGLAPSFELMIKDLRGWVNDNS